jgi:hypothetical protein
LGVTFTIGAAGCGDDDSDAGFTCAEIDPQCTAGIKPTWDEIYQFVISEQCAASGCHGAGMAAGGLQMSTKTDAYAGLVTGVGGKPRVIKGDAACSVLTERIESDDEAKRMPYKAAKLPAGDRCAIEKWIAAGAPE